MSARDPKAVAESIGKAIAARRIRCGLTQDQVAERMGIGSEAVSRLERGVITPNVARLFDFADAFGCEAAELLGEMSPRITDQAQRVTALLQGLNPADRKMLLEMVEALTARLSK